MLQATTDGNIVLYGSFRYVAGQPRIGLARLTNIEPPTRAAAALRPLTSTPTRPRLPLR